MLDARFLAVLHVIHDRLHGSSINWAVTGSVGMVLQGMDLTPHDIDLQSDTTGVYEIESIFAEYSTWPVSLRTSDRLQSRFGALEIDGVKVEIMGDMQNRLPDGAWSTATDFRRHKRWVDVDGMHIPVLNLEHEYQAYLLMGRTEKAALLRRWLDSRTSSLQQ